MNPITKSSPVPTPFLFRGYSDLCGEMAIDDLFITVPATRAEADAIGFFYPAIYDPKDPFATVERARHDYAGPTKRYIFLLCRETGTASLRAAVMDANRHKAPIEIDGLFQHFMDQAVSFLRSKGVAPEHALAMLYPQAGGGAKPNDVMIARWVLGYERATGHTTVIDCSAGSAQANLFLSGSNSIKTAI